MTSKGVSALLDALFIYGKAEGVENEDKSSLSRCSKHLKNLVDATVTKARVASSSGHLNAAFNALINTEWYGLQQLNVLEGIYQNTLEDLPSSLFIIFSRPETLKIGNCFFLKALPEEIGELSHVKSLSLDISFSLSALPSSFGKLTALENLSLIGCCNLTPGGIAPLQHLTGLKTLKTYSNRANDKMIKYPDFLCNLTSLKNLELFSSSIETLPDALDNLTNLETLRIQLNRIEELPESIGDLNSLKGLLIFWCTQLTSLPESLDDLLWRKAHATDGSRMESIRFPVNAKTSVFSQDEASFRNYEGEWSGRSTVILSKRV